VDRLNHDFTLDKYRELCKTILDRGYSTLTVYDYLERHNAGDNMLHHSAIMRHDVDRKTGNALRLAELEHSLGIHSTYYFRYPYTFKPEIIRQIHSLGHEIGYHYEVLAKAKGHYGKAIRLFDQELRAMREVCDIKTICMHGSPLSRYDNRDLWKHYDFRDFGITGEAYISLQDAGLRYFTDTGRSWSGRNSVRDVMPGTVPSVETTDDLIDWIGSAGDLDLYLSVHPERWAANEGEWVIGYAKDLMMNAGKTVVAAMR